MEGNVLGAINGGEPGYRVAARAADLARTRRMGLVLLHVVDDDLVRNLPGSFHRPAPSAPALAVVGEHLLEAAAATLPPDAPVPVRVVRRGALVAEVRTVAAEHDVRVVVVGAHKRRLLQAHRGHDWDRFKRETGLELVVVK